MKLHISQQATNWRRWLTTTHSLFHLVQLVIELGNRKLSVQQTRMHKSEIIVRSLSASIGHCTSMHHSSVQLELVP